MIGWKQTGEFLSRIITGITEDARKYAAEQGVSEEEALQKGMEDKSREFAENGNEIYARE